MDSNLFLNISKYEVCMLTLKLQLFIFYILLIQNVARCSNVKDLGALFDKLFFSDHAIQAANGAYKR